MKKKFPALPQITEDLCRAYFPETQIEWDKFENRRKVSNQYVFQPKIACTWPGVYVETFSVKIYKQQALENREATEPEAIKTEQVVTVPRRYVCVQCHESFDRLGAFKGHFKDGD
jgi:hypothetical protein